MSELKEEIKRTLEIIFEYQTWSSIPMKDRAFIQQMSNRLDAQDYKFTRRQLFYLRDLKDKLLEREKVG